MALYFTKKKRWPPSKPIQYTLAFLGLILAIVILSSWLIIRYHRSAPAAPSEQESTGTTAVEKSTEVDHVLLIFDFEDAERFVLVQSNPNTNAINIVPLPTNLCDSDGCILSEAIHQHGASTVTASVAQTLHLPIEHYFSFTAKGVEQLLGQLDSGLTFKVPESIAYTDENGATIRLSAGEHLLSASQVRSLLEYKSWKKTKNKDGIAAELTIALINQYLVEGRSIDGYFSALSNNAVTDLRIDNFNAYRTALSQLASHNTGNICQRIDLKGTQKDGIFIPDLDHLQQKTALYN